MQSCGYVPCPGFEPGLLRPQRNVLTTIRARQLNKVVVFDIKICKNFLPIRCSTELSTRVSEPSRSALQARLASLVVCFSLWVREVTGSIPVQAQNSRIFCFKHVFDILKKSLFFVVVPSTLQNGKKRVPRWI